MFFSQLGAALNRFMSVRFFADLQRGMHGPAGVGEQKGPRQGSVDDTRGHWWRNQSTFVQLLKLFRSVLTIDVDMSDQIIIGQQSGTYLTAFSASCY